MPRDAACVGDGCHRARRCCHRSSGRRDGSYFTLRGARLQIEHEERDAWRSRLVAAAERFLESYERASHVYGGLSQEVVNAREEGRSLGMRRHPSPRQNDSHGTC